MSKEEKKDQFINLQASKATKARKSTGKAASGTSKHKKTSNAKHAGAAASEENGNTDKENHAQGFMSAANFLNKDRAAPPPLSRKLPAYFAKKS